MPFPSFRASIGVEASFKKDNLRLSFQKTLEVPALKTFDAESRSRPNDLKRLVAVNEDVLGEKKCQRRCLPRSSALWGGYRRLPAEYIGSPLCQGVLVDAPKNHHRRSVYSRAVR